MKNYSDSLKVRFALFPMITLILSLSGCASIFRVLDAGSFQGYPGAQLPRDSLAFISTYIEYPDYLARTYVMSLDGKAIEGGTRTEFIELLPGKHTLCVMYARSWKYACANLETVVRAGRLYKLYSVKYTHQDKWYPALRDVTDELDFPEQSDTRAAFDNMLKKTGREPLPQVSSVSDRGRLAGFGERKKIAFPGKAGQEVHAEYDFNRYAPFIEVMANDWRTYHLRVAQDDGAVAEVLGTRIRLDSRNVFHPTGSDLAYVYGYAGLLPDEVFAVYREISVGNYRLVRQMHSVEFQDYSFQAMLDATNVDYRDRDARRALALSANADPDKLMKKKELVAELLKRSESDREEFRKSLNLYALQLAQEAVRSADALAAKYPAGNPFHERVLEIVKATNEKLKECESRN